MADPILKAIKGGPDPNLAALLLRLDKALAEFLAVRDEVAALLPPVGHRFSAESADADDLLDTHAAAARFGYPRDTIALWCRQGLGRRRQKPDGWPWILW